MKNRRIFLSRFNYFFGDFDDDPLLDDRLISIFPGEAAEDFDDEEEEEVDEDFEICRLSGVTEIAGNCSTGGGEFG